MKSLDRLFFLAIEIIFIILIIFLFPLPTNISFFSKYITCISALLIANIYQKYNLKHLQILYYQILPMFPISTCIVCKVPNSKVLLMIKWDHELNQGGWHYSDDRRQWKRLLSTSGTYTSEMIQHEMIFTCVLKSRIFWGPSTLCHLEKVYIWYIKRSGVYLY